MKIKIAVLTALFIAVSVVLSFGIIIKDDNGFPYKGIVIRTKTFQNIGAVPEDFQTTKSTYFTWEFTVKGKKYKADLLSFGAIYMTREGQNPVVITFDLEDYTFKRFNVETLFLNNR